MANGSRFPKPRVVNESKGDAHMEDSIFSITYKLMNSVASLRTRPEPPPYRPVKCKYPLSERAPPKSYHLSQASTSFLHCLSPSPPFSSLQAALVPASRSRRGLIRSSTINFRTLRRRVLAVQKPQHEEQVPSQFPWRSSTIMRLIHSRRTPDGQRRTGWRRIWLDRSS